MNPYKFIVVNVKEELRKSTGVKFPTPDQINAYISLDGERRANEAEDVGAVFYTTFPMTVDVLPVPGGGWVLAAKMVSEPEHPLTPNIVRAQEEGITSVAQSLGLTPMIIVDGEIKPKEEVEAMVEIARAALE